VTGRQNETVASGQFGSAASNFRNCVNSTVAMSAAHRQAGMPELAFSTASMASRGSHWPYGMIDARHDEIRLK